jgi:hypothetical protein
MEIEKLDKQKVKSQDRIRVGSRIKNEEKEGKERQTRMRRRGELSFVIQLETMTSDESSLDNSHTCPSSCPPYHQM